MKLTITSTLRTLCNDAGFASGGRLKDRFPSVVHPDYTPVWKEFIKTQVVKEIYNKYSREAAPYYACIAFISHIKSIDPKAVRPKPDFLKAADLFDLKSPSKKLKDFITRKRLVDGLRQHSHKREVLSYNHDFIRSIVDPEIKGTVEYKTTSKRPLDYYMSFLVPTVFSQVPDELRSKVKGKTKNFKPASEIANSNQGFVTLLSENGLSLEIARAKYNTLVLRYSLDIPGILPYGDSDKSMAINLLDKRAKRDIYL